MLQLWRGDTLDDTTALKEYPPASARPSHPPQSQPQVSRPVREVASPIRENPVPPASDKRTKMREHGIKFSDSELKGKIKLK